MFGNKVYCLFLFIVVGGVLGAEDSVVEPDAGASTYQTISGVCSGNGAFHTNKVITSVMIMGAENERRLHIAVDNSQTVFATKSYEAAKISDQFLIDAVIKANLLKSVVDLCVTGNTSELYGIHLK